MQQWLSDHASLVVLVGYLIGVIASAIFFVVVWVDLGLSEEDKPILILVATYLTVIWPIALAALAGLAVYWLCRYALFRVVRGAKHAAE